MIETRRPKRSQEENLMVTGRAIWFFVTLHGFDAVNSLSLSRSRTGAAEVQEGSGYACMSALGAVCAATTFFATMSNLTIVQRFSILKKVLCLSE